MRTTARWPWWRRGGGKPLRPCQQEGAGCGGARQGQWRRVWQFCHAKRGARLPAQPDEGAARPTGSLTCLASAALRLAWARSSWRSLSCASAVSGAAGCSEAVVSAPSPPGACADAAGACGSAPAAGAAEAPAAGSAPAPAGSVAALAELAGRLKKESMLFCPMLRLPEPHGEPAAVKAVCSRRAVARLPVLPVVLLLTASERLTPSLTRAPDARARIQSRRSGP